MEDEAEDVSGEKHETYSKHQTILKTNFLQA